MTHTTTLKKWAAWTAIFALIFAACNPEPKHPDLLTVRLDAAAAQKKAREIESQVTAKLADGLQISLWASDSLANDPTCMAIDNQGRVYLTNSNRQLSSEFDIRGHQDWMTQSISFQTVEDRQAFLRKEFAPENSKKNEYLKDLNNDGSHDWHDLTVEKDDIWRLEDTDGDGLADVSSRVVHDFNTEVTDVAEGLLVRDHDAFVAIAPDLWHFEDINGDGMWDKKSSIATGFQVHIGFGGHGMSGVREGPDGRIYWGIGDIGANITTVDGRKIENPNSGFICRSNPDGSDFEIFATGVRNTYEFVFDDYGNIITSDNDGDHAGESERLVHIVEGHDAGWRSNWQYGKYTDPKNNGYNVWMDEKLYVPRWEGQAAYIIPPIMNYHNGPTGMVYNPGTALGKDWVKKFFLVEFVGTTTGSHIWSFGLKPKGASFELDGEKDVLSGILPTGIQFGPDGALYVADWINGWDPKEEGRVWKIDVTKEKNNLEVERKETKRLMQLDYTAAMPERLATLMGYSDQRIRLRAQFELVKRGKAGIAELKNAIAQKENQMERIHAIWGMGQFLRKDKKYAAELITLLKDKDEEIIVQALRMLGDSEIKSIGNDIIPMLQSANPRLQFYAAEVLGQIKHEAAIQPLINLLKENNDADLYLRHAAVLALTRIGKAEPMIALAYDPSKALRTAAVLVLRRLQNENVQLFLQDQDEYIVTEAARAINDDLSIPVAMPALAGCLADKRFTSEPLLRRAIGAAQRLGGDKELDLLFEFSKRTDLSDAIKTEALAALGTWANPSETDRVDGRYRGKVERDPAKVQAKVKSYITNYLTERNPATLIAVANMLVNLNIMDANGQLAIIYATTQNSEVKMAILPALKELKYGKIEELIKLAMADADEKVRATGIGLLSDETVSKERLPELVQLIFTKGSIKEQQQLLVTMGKLDDEKIQPVLADLFAKFKNKEIPPSLSLELREAIDSSGSSDLIAQMAAIKIADSNLGEYETALFGGNSGSGRGIFYWNSTAQCVRCHAINGEGATVGPDLGNIGNTLTREQILEAMVDPSARIAPGYGNVVLKLKDGSEVFGMLTKETAEELTLKTNNAEPLKVPVSRISKRENLLSGMPPMGEALKKRELRDLVEYLSSLKK
ncbi:MAG: HEAT repeat domain-containing protein [Saprospiraceae bacterium]|nr:HEAT repeat domain-containing protein [Saprospiraceae bacterium]MCF8250672.1 HEAT repeat domain-containing protein [Saprospiraceae bacterium]MCF8280810.1 HEAT repeat domain-containing protein [Bacteroidales bacterium]MCF8312524.1 HEAT repeat domain-containing protein [Saprospiraceae bacterium]MCF8440796.1 HEAT repeat domain-containing protein [Saprospiraceae bacterium]